MYGEGSCWQGYEKKVKAIKMADIVKNTPLVSKRIVTETADSNMSFLYTPRNCSTKQSLTHFVPEYRTGIMKGVLSTLEKIDGPSIHVNSTRKLKSEMIDHARALSIISGKVPTTIDDVSNLCDITTNPRIHTRTRLKPYTRSNLT